MKTDYISVAEAARRWGVTPRQVQRLLAEKRIPGARRHGRAWLIPRTADKPADNCQNRRARAGEGVGGYDMGCAMPLLCGVFAAGKCRAAIDALPDPARRLAEAELCLYTARADEAARLCAELVEADDVCLRLSALLLTAMASVACGDAKKAYTAVRRISAYYDRVKDADLPDELRATVIFALLTPSVLLHIDHPSTPDPERYIRYLPEGLKLWGYYICAFISYLGGDYEEALGTAKAALNMSPLRHTIMDICLELLISMALMELKRTAEAQTHFMAAWALARPDGLIFILGEHHSALQGLIESCLKKSYPEDYRAVIAVADAFNAGRKKLHAAPLSADAAPETLSTTERIIASLAVRGWTNMEIAAHLGLSVHTIKKYISVIYQKLGISGRKELKAFITQQETR